jgi:membrane-associated phospholipid phosphatase
MMAAVTPLACLAATLALQDWEGLKQGALAGVTTVACSYGLKYLVKKERPDKSDSYSFPSLHTSVSFTGAAFLQRRYGWKWGIAAYAAASYVGWARTYARRHDWLDVSAGAALGVLSAYIYTSPFARKHTLVISPMAAGGSMGVYAAMAF